MNKTLIIVLVAITLVGLTIAVSEGLGTRDKEVEDYENYTKCNITEFDQEQWYDEIRQEFVRCFNSTGMKRTCIRTDNESMIDLMVDTQIDIKKNNCLKKIDGENITIEKVKGKIKIKDKFKDK